MSSPPLDVLERQRADLTDDARSTKKQIRALREHLQDVGRRRRELIELMHTQFGIEVVLVDADGNEQGVEATHGRKETDTQAR